MRYLRVLAATVLASSSAILFAACGDHNREGEWDDDRGGRRGDYCASYSTCGTCTPVSGCGWCTYEDGTGSCSSEPDRCTGSTFRWNWEPEGCSTPVDAGRPETTTPVDASDATPATDGPASADSISNLPDDTAKSDAAETSSSDAPTSCTAPSRATIACVQTTGGTLCASGEYTLACHPDVGGTPVPDGSLGCKVVATGTSTATFYCCPCPAS